MVLRFHWRLTEGRETREGMMRGGRDAAYKAVPDLEAQQAFCRVATAAGIDSLLVDINYAKPDPMTLAMALVRKTERITFLVAHRPGLMSPTLFTQQVNTFAVHGQGRISLNMVAGHSPAEQAYYGDYLVHDDRYRRMEEFLAICHGLWRNDGPYDFEGGHYRAVGARLNTPFHSPHGTHPEIYVAGNSSTALDVAGRQASCWVRFGDAPEHLEPLLRKASNQGVEVCLRMSVIARPSRAEAHEAAERVVTESAARLAGERAFVAGSDAQAMKQTAARAEREDWLTPWLWAGAVPSHGAPSLALVGTPEDVARGIMAFAAIGVTQFIFSGWPKLNEMRFFGERVLPLVREMEAATP